jgi:hypothetical protein
MHYIEYHLKFTRQQRGNRHNEFHRTGTLVAHVRRACGQAQAAATGLVCSSTLKHHILAALS